MNRFKSFSEWLYSRAGWKTLLASIVLFFLFMLVVLPNVAETSKEMTGTIESPDGSYLYSSAELYKIADEYGEKGRAYYIQSRFTFDVIWPLVYLSFLAAALTVLYRVMPSANPFRAVHLIPFGGAFFDYLENAASSAVMARYPEKTPVIAELTPIFSFVKWSLIYASFGLLFLGILINIVVYIKKHTKKSDT
ncbi:hypothetical protein [Metabacillus idriensis]|uniref:hypothetical protein n=1 Tax=Metabacillus idriensis TaxID=324768 RepID=UPI003D2D31D6